MFRITASTGDDYMEVGREEGLFSAIQHADNMGTMFSEGGPRPADVWVRISNDDESIVIEHQYYNGFCRLLESIGV